MSIGLVIWALATLFVVIEIFPTGIYWLVYYVANYHSGFVRRGLGGHIITLFPVADYFKVAYVLVWLPAVIWTTTLGWLMWVILNRSDGARSERKLMLALLIPVLPFGYAYGVSAPRPELVAMAALVMFSAALVRFENSGPRRRSAQLFAITIAILAFVHEAIPLESILGALLAVNVLAADAGARDRRVISAWAVLPGCVATLVVIACGKRNLGHRICDQVPHGWIENPYAANTSSQRSIDYLLGRQSSVSDYHNWVCQFITYHYDLGFRSGLREVMHLGPLPLFVSCISGLAVLGVTIWIIGYLSGVRSIDFLAILRRRPLSLAMGLAAMIPLFLAGSDWLRWWVIITFNIAIVYIMYVRTRPELEQPPEEKTRRVFVGMVIVLALLPIGPNGHVGGRGFHTRAMEPSHFVEYGVTAPVFRAAE